MAADVCSVSDGIEVFLACSFNKNPILLPATVTSIVALFAACIAALSLRANYILARSKNALDFEKNLEESVAYDNYNKQLKSFKNQTSSDSAAIVGLAKDPSIDPEAYEAAIELLNWWERGANGIRCKVYRDDVLRKVYCTHFLSLSAYLEPFVEQRKKSRENPYIFIEFLWLKRRWEIKRYLQKINPINKLLKTLFFFVIVIVL